MKIESYKVGSKYSWRIDVTVAGTRIREKDFGTKKAAEEFIVELKEKARRRRYGLEIDAPQLGLAELAKAYRAKLPQDRNGARAKVILAEFLCLFAEGFLVNEVTAADIGRFVDALRKRNAELKPDTINRYLSVISGMFVVVSERFPQLEEAGWRRPKFPWLEVSKRGRERIIKVEESRRLLNELRFPGRQEYRNRRETPSTIATRRDVADALEIGLNTAMRPGEVRRLLWSQVDLDAGEVHLTDRTKTKEPRDIPMNRRVREILRRRSEGRTSSWVFPNRAGTGPRDEISKVLRPLAKRLGLEYGAELENGFTPHSQRHTATTQMLRGGNDLATVKSITGHSDTTMALRYAHATHESRRRAVEGLVTSTDGRQNLDKK